MVGEIARSAFVFLAVLVPMMLFMLDGSVHSLTIFFTFFVFLQVWNMLNVRFFDRKQISFAAFFRNRAFWFVMFLIVLGQIAIVEFGGKAFRTESLALHEWLYIAGASSVILIVGLAGRLIGRAWKARRAQA